MTPGQILKAEREAKHIGVSEVAQSLLLGKNTINAIEEDDYSKIVAQVYAEGYLRAYAKFLHIPKNTVIDSFRRLNVYSKPEDKIETKTQTTVQTRLNLLKKRVKIRYILGIITVLILAILVGRQIFGRNEKIISIPKVVSDVTIDVNNGMENDAEG